MLRIAWRLFYFALLASALAYVVYLIGGATIYAQEELRQRTVWVRDHVSPNMHRLAGMVTLPSSCMELTVKTVQLSPSAFTLIFETWEHPYVECEHVPTRVAFHEIVFAPALGITFIATLDGKPLPIIVAPVLP